MREYPEQSSRLTSGAESSEAAFMPNSVLPLLIAATLALPLAPAQQPPVPSIDPPSGERLLLRVEVPGTGGQTHQREGKPRRQPFRRTHLEAARRQRGKGQPRGLEACARA